MSEPKGRWVPTGKSWGSDSHFVRASRLRDEGKLEEARDALIVAIRDEGAGTGGELELLRVLADLDDVDGVLARAAALEARGVESVGIGVARARAYVSSGRHEDAMAAARSAIAIDPDHYGAWRALLVAAHRAKHADAFFEAARRITELAPEDANAWWQLGCAAKDLNRFDVAVDAAERCVALKPEVADAHYNVACYRALAGRTDAALEALEEAIERKAELAADAKADSDFAAIRADSRFVALCGR